MKDVKNVVDVLYYDDILPYVNGSTKNTEAAYNLYNKQPAASSAAWFDPRHNNKYFNTMFFDCHVEAWTLNQVDNKDSSPPSYFWYGGKK